MKSYFIQDCNLYLDELIRESNGHTHKNYWLEIKMG